MSWGVRRIVPREWARVVILAVILDAVSCLQLSGGSRRGGGTGGNESVDPSCPAVGSGALVLAVTGLPADANARMRVGGGHLGDSFVAFTPGVPVSLDAGPGYFVTVTRVKAAPIEGSVVGRVFSPLSSNFGGCVHTDETTTVTIDYLQEFGSQKMWIAAVNPPRDDLVFAGFDGMTVSTSGMKASRSRRVKYPPGPGGGGAFDRLGSFWVPAGDLINEYDANALSDGLSEAPPSVKLGQRSTASANFVAFDPGGRMWVSHGAPGTDREVVCYGDPGGLQTSGTPFPSVVLKSADMTNPAGIAFDSDGSLWVADSGNDNVLKFSAARLGASYSGPADVVIRTKTSSTPPVSNARYSRPVALAFDRMSNLLIGYTEAIVRLSPGQQAASTDIVGPLAVNVSGGTGSFAFDESGGLWLAGGPGAGATFQRFPAAALATGGDVTPDIVIESSELGSAGSIVLDPSPTWSTVHDWF